MKLRKTQVAAAVGAALFVAGTAVYAQTAPTVQVYGQVSRTLLYADDGTQSKWFHVDNEASGTRLGVTGTGQAMPTLRYGFRLEWDFQSNESQRATFGPANPASDSPASSVGTGNGQGFSERHADAWLEGAWGRLNIGQGDGASNGATESDLSGTGMANGIGVADIGGGFQYRTSAAALSGLTVGASINQQDFESRYDRLMYVTPTFGGFRAQVSHGQKAGGTAVGTVGGTLDVKEASVWYGGKMGGLGELAAALGWSSKDGTPTTTKDEYIGGSISWLHGSGINLTYSYSSRDNPVAIGAASRDSTFNYLKLGWKRGAHAVAVDWAKGEDFVTVGDEATMYGIGYVWNPVRWLEIYAAYKIHSAQTTAAGDLEDVKIGHVGTRIRF
jgi:hypothetical protein